MLLLYYLSIVTQIGNMHKLMNFPSARYLYLHSAQPRRIIMIMEISEIKNSFLNGHSLFGGLTDDQLSDVREFLKIQTYKKGDVLLTQGESNSTLFFIVSGTAAVVKHCSTEASDASDASGETEGTEKTQETAASGSFRAAESSGSSEYPDAAAATADAAADSIEDRELARLTKGDSFGEMELIDIQPCAASVIALTDTEVITFTNYDLYKLSKEHPKTHTMIVMNLAREMSRRLRKMDERFVMELYDHTQ